jgi:hypothetical protein
MITGFGIGIPARLKTRVRSFEKKKMAIPWSTGFSF